MTQTLRERVARYWPVAAVLFMAAAEFAAGREAWAIGSLGAAAFLALMIWMNEVMS